MPRQPDPMTGQTLGPYRLEERLGAGGMGVVYRARDTRLERTVALKLIGERLADDETARARLLREARLASALNHPNIGVIYEVGEAGIGPGGEAAAQAYIAMEYVEGQPLSELIPEGGLPPETAIRYATQVAGALAHAHDRGVVHRDLKTSNVVITPEGHAKILDFGVARRLAEQELSQMTRSQAVPAVADEAAGTLHYMAPEVLLGETADARADIWAFGVLLHEMAAGELPFRGRTGFELSSAILREPPPPLPAKVSAGLRAVIQRCLQKDIGQRYQRAGEARAALETLASHPAAVIAEAEPPRKATSWKHWAIVGVPGLIVGLVMLLLALDVGGWRARRKEGPRPQKVESIAVLPLENLSGDPEQDYFADGMTEALIADLARIGALRVSSRTSVMQYKKARKPLRQIARELEVDAVVEGSVQRSGDRVQVTAQLIDARTDKHLWAQSYERAMSDVLALEREVARAIAQGIQVRLTPRESAHLAGARAVDPEAYEAYLRGRFFWNQRTEDSLRKAIENFEKAIQKDPHYAPAYTGLADSYNSLGFAFDAGALMPSEALPKARAAALKALEIDPSSAEAHTSLAFILLLFDWDWPAAEREFKRALELDPNYANAHHWYSHYLMAMGRVDDSLAESRRALALSGVDVVINLHLGWHFIYARQYDQALEQIRKTLEMDPNAPLTNWYMGMILEQKRMPDQAVAQLEKAVALSPRPVFKAFLAHAYAMAGKRAQAQKLVAELQELSRKKYVPAYAIAIIYAGLGQKDQAFEWLERAYRERSDVMVYLKVEPTVDSLRSDARFADLVRRVGLP